MRRFFAPREIDYGWGALEVLKRLSAQKALIVAGPRLEKVGHVNRVASMLSECGVESHSFTQVEPEPSKDTVLKIFNQAQEFQPDLIIGLGGGSNIDAAKATWAYYENPGLASMAWADVPGAVRKAVFRQKARLVAIPSTSGTGTEVSNAAMITDNDVSPPVKAALISAQMVPDIAIVDAEIAATMPPAVTADSGFDALVHAAESFVLSSPSDLNDGLTVRVIQTTLNWLPKAVANGDDREARERMHLAGTMAGMVFSNGRLGLLHALGHQLESSTGISHGRSLALLIDHFLAYHLFSASARIKELAQSLSMPANSEREAAESLVTSLSALRRAIGIPASIKEAGADEAKFAAHLDKLAANAIASGMTPKDMSPDEIRTVYHKAWEGIQPELA